MNVLLANAFDERIRLTNSQYGVMPLSLLCLAGAVCERFQTHIIDFIPFFIKSNTPSNQELDSVFIDKVKAVRPHVLGINCLFSMHMKRVMELARLAKAVVPEILVVIGGTHPTVFARDILENAPEVDY